MSQNFECILFDLGFVLIELNGMPWFKKHHPDLSDQEIHRRWIDLACVYEFETGQIQAAEFFQRAPIELNVDISPSDFEIAFRSWVSGPYPGAEALLRELNKNFKTACLSNTNTCHIEDLEKNSDFLELFSQRFYSYEMNAMKPDPSIYKSALDRLGIQAEAVLFIDDSLDNVNAALDTGIQAYQAKGFEQTLEVLKSNLHLPSLNEIIRPI